MRILIAGASGAIGRALVRRLRANQHEVFALTQSRDSAAVLKEIGAEPVIADALDAAAVKAAVGQIRLDAVINELTSVPRLSLLKSRPARFICILQADPLSGRSWADGSTLRSCLRTHRELALENLALRQQLAVWTAPRRVQPPSVVEVPRVGGLHQEYLRRAA